MAKNKLIVYIPHFGARAGGNRTVQRKMLDEFLEQPHDHEQEVVAEFEETEPGLVEFRKALAKAKSTGHGLLIPRIGYLSKNLKFLRVLAEEGTDAVWRALDDARFNTTTFQIYLSEAKDVWHQRRSLIKDRMAKAKKQGAKFGTRRKGAKTKAWRAAEPWNSAAAASVVARRKRADDAYVTLIPEILAMLASGKMWTEIANILNESGHVTTTNSPFTASTVMKIIKRHKRQGGRNAEHGKDAVGRKALAVAVR